MPALTITPDHLDRALDALDGNINGIDRECLVGQCLQERYPGKEISVGSTALWIDWKITVNTSPTVRDIITRFDRAMDGLDNHKREAMDALRQSLPVTVDWPGLPDPEGETHA